MEDHLLGEIKVLNELVWENKASKPQIDEWLLNFDPSPASRERLHALYLLSQFMYFGDKEIRELLKALYRDLYRYPLLEAIRRSNSDTTDCNLIGAAFELELTKTRFLGLGRASESGDLLLYFFRQVNDLPKGKFISTSDVFKPVSEFATRQFDLFRNPEEMLEHPDVIHYVFIDDLCGSGSQAELYSKDILSQMKAVKPSIKAYYYPLFSTVEGLEYVRSNTLFDRVECVCSLDETYRSFGPRSRYFPTHLNHLSKEFGRRMCCKYAHIFSPYSPLGFADNELMIGFLYNTPDNTLPIFWFEGLGSNSWYPMFKRYSKKYGA